MMIQPRSMRAVQDFWELIMMSWSLELLRGERTRKFSIGVSNAAEDLVKKKFLFGTHLSPSAAGGTKPATICKRPRNALVGKIAMIFKPGSICMTPKRAGVEIQFRLGSGDFRWLGSWQLPLQIQRSAPQRLSFALKM